MPADNANKLKFLYKEIFLVLSNEEKKGANAVLDELTDKNIKTNRKTVNRYLKILHEDGVIRSEIVLISRNKRINIYFLARKKFPEAKYL